MLKHHPPNAYFTVLEAAQALKISVSWLNKARLKGDGPIYTKIGRRVVYSSDELNKWLAVRMFASTSAYSQ